MVARDSGKERKWEVAANGYEVSSWGDENIVEFDNSDGYIILWIN